MAYPFTFKYQQNDMNWTSGEQPVPVSTGSQLWGMAKAAGFVSAVATVGRHRFKGGKLGFDYYIQAARYLEEYSPGHIFRTFQISHMLSPFESPSRVSRIYSPEIISKLAKDYGGRVWLENLEREFGAPILTGEIAQRGFRFVGGKVYAGAIPGESDRVLLEHASIVRSPTGARPVLQEARARSLIGGPLSGTEIAFKAKIPYINEELLEVMEPHTIIGGHTRAQAAKRGLFGYGTALAERMNQLAKSPAELPIISGLFKGIRRIPGFSKFHLDVVPSSGLKTLGKITAKLGLVGTAAYIGYQELDYLTRKSSLFEGTLFDEGITAGLATVWTRGQLKLSKAAELLGAHDYREWQEGIAPGSTEISKLLALPIMGALGGLGVSYGIKLSRQIKLQRAGLGLAQASLAATAEDEFFRASVVGRQVRPEVLSALDQKSIALIQQATATRLEGYQGRIARWITKKAERRTLGGSILRTFGEMSPARLRWMGGMLAGATLIAPFIPGALIPSDRPEELEALYSGQKKVAIRKGRWWEFGRSQFEGTTIDRWQEHWYPRLFARSKERAIWGEDAPGPLRRWFIENFTYDLERMHYRDRPYPISGAAFEDVPFLGPILAATLGRFIKPPAFMHVQEWMRQGKSGEEYRAPFPKFQEVTLPGELEKGAPVSPYDIEGIAGEEVYRMQEMVGLPGFTIASLKEKITGTPDLFAQEMQLESARRIYGAEREYWDKELGGGLGTTEIIRRLYPHRRRQIELYNPIPNTMPDWLPGPGDRSPDFRHGDPYTKVAQGEERLPGPGYAALHPELRGVAPEDYPLMHRFSILADIAPYSESYGRHLSMVRSASKRGDLRKQEIEQYHEIMRQIHERKTKKTFTPYQFRTRENTPMEGVLAAANEREKLAAGKTGSSWFEKVVGSYWETLGHGAETPLEFLTPVSPAAKLLHMRTAIEDYERTQVWGSDSAFWEHPLRDFLGPFARSVGRSLGSDTIPGAVQDKRDLEEYFDLLKYVKYTRLKTAAQVSGDMQVAQEMESKRRETLFGVNPFTYNFTHIMRALPRRERDYFNAFSEADMEERSQIYNMIPENERALYMARWKLKDAGDMQKAIKKGLLSEEQIAKSEAALEELYLEKETEGLPKDRELWAEYLATRMSGESYPDWYRRTKLLAQKLEDRPLPGPDWVGWHPAVDLEDIKLKIVKDAGENMYEYDLWPDRLRALARRPMVEEAAEEVEGPGMDREALRKRIDEILSAHNIQATQVSLISAGSGQSSVNIEIQEDRSKSDKNRIRRMS